MIFFSFFCGWPGYNQDNFITNMSRKEGKFKEPLIK